MTDKYSQELLEKIDAYVKGRLNDSEIDALWVEIAKNPTLIDELEIQIGVKKLLDEKRAGNKASHKKSTPLPYWAWHAGAAISIVLILLIQLFRVETLTELDDFILYNIPLDQIETNEALRSKNVVTSEVDSLLNLGFQLIYDGDLIKADRTYNQIITNYSDENSQSRAYLNIGILQYNKGDYLLSAASFEEAVIRAEKAPIVMEKALWFMSNAYARVDSLDKALYASGQTYIKKGVFKDSAFRLYQKLSFDLGYFKADPLRN